MNSYTIELSASRNRDGGTYQYRTYIYDESSFRQRVNSTLSHGQDVSTIFSRLHEGQICTLGNRMLTDEQAAGFGWTC
jgi:hypothetical protein